ncbi:unnamed protein product, partial [Prorocentrum cordatum]
PRRAAAHGSLLGKGSLGLVLFCQPEARRGADPLTAAAARAVSSREEEEADRRERERERERDREGEEGEAGEDEDEETARIEDEDEGEEGGRPRGRGEAHSWSSPAARAGRAGRGAVRPASRRRPLRRPAASRERREARSGPDTPWAPPVASPQHEDGRGSTAKSPGGAAGFADRPGASGPLCPRPMSTWGRSRLVGPHGRIGPRSVPSARPAGREFERGRAACQERRGGGGGGGGACATGG